jgi:multidrug efflux system outer membrane protein
VDEKMPTYDLENSWHTPVSVPFASEQCASHENWWEVFRDKDLNALIEEGLEKSPTIDKAFARFEEALYFTKVTGADQYPQLSLNGYGDRRRIPQSLQSAGSVPTGNLITPTTPANIPVPNTGVPPITLPPIIVPAAPEMKTVSSPVFVNDLIANLLVSYELDFWGKYYLKTEASRNRSEEAKADLETAQLLLADQIAATYFTIQAATLELSIIRDEICVHADRVSLLQKQLQSGLTDTFLLLQEEATLESKKNDEQALLRSKDLNTSLLAVLVGREPNSATLTVGTTPWSFPVVPPGLPSSLLAKRPDIRSSMKEVDALIAEIGAAKTELLPAISLSAAAGYQAGKANEWFKWKNRIWSLATSVSQPLFDAGQRFAQVDVAKARFREAAGSLTETVLNSVKEVEDALVAIRTQKERSTAALKREKDFSVISELRSELCASGVQDYLIVLQAKEDLLQVQRERTQEEFNLQLGTLALMKSLGGSWGDTQSS